MVACQIPAPGAPCGFGASPPQEDRLCPRNRSRNLPPSGADSLDPASLSGEGHTGEGRVGEATRVVLGGWRVGDSAKDMTERTMCGPRRMLESPARLGGPRPHTHCHRAVAMGGLCFMWSLLCMNSPPPRCSVQQSAPPTVWEWAVGRVPPCADTPVTGEMSTGGPEGEQPLL